ncbi:type IV pilin protein [Metapseudomonas otitidis]|uniref:type IV pilin protein n=1 Tax=Metapseudomonas otitidis TaxID=319939 RepID=UPI0013F681E7|nr:type IV pilin protein [Pseudomonas otitidis]
MNAKGFTLIELLITVVVLSILASIALPSYTYFVLRSNRSEGQAYLNDVVARQERFFTQNNVYVISNADISRLGVPAQSRTGLYQLTVSAGGASDGGYVLTATAIGKQASDDDCKTLTLNAVGDRGSTGTGTLNDCWR